MGTSCASNFEEALFHSNRPVVSSAGGWLPGAFGTETCQSAAAPIVDVVWKRIVPQ
jgi:hypothetical protein